MTEPGGQRRYQTILVAVDNSEHSRYAEEAGVLLAKTAQATLTGLHVYSGSFHRTRFNALEQHLPKKYQTEDVLSYQRKIHSVLIERGLEIISYEYMKNLKDACAQQKVRFEEKLVDGKNSDTIIDHAGFYDLIMMGAQGMGAVPGYQTLGSNTERVLRHATTDVCILRKPTEFDRIAVGIDGSPASLLALQQGIDLSKMFNATLSVFSSFDPQFHPVVFQSLVSVLSDEAGKVFKFKEQEQLHNQVIDTSLEQLYTEHLRRAMQHATQNGITVTTELLKGKPYCSLCDRTNRTADLLIVGRSGMHQGRHETIGSNAERIARFSQTNILIVGMNKENHAIPLSHAQPQVQSAHDVKVIWDDEAKKRLENIPRFARPMAVLAIERYAKEQGIQRITPEVMKAARENHEP
jgi:nucleotide-binding universal stress UspA family protein